MRATPFYLDIIHDIQIGISDACIFLFYFIYKFRKKVPRFFHIAYPTTSVFGILITISFS